MSHGPAHGGSRILFDICVQVQQVLELADGNPGYLFLIQSGNREIQNRTDRINGGNPVTVNGPDLAMALAVSNPAGCCSGVGIVNDNTLTCYTPAHAAGAVTVSVYTPYGDGHGNKPTTPEPDQNSVTPNAGVPKMADLPNTN